MSRCSAARFGGLSTFRHAIAAVFALALFPLSALADSGITGRIISMETGSTLGFANVTAVRTDVAPDDTSALPRNTISNGDGSFRLACEPGTYRLTTNYVGFSPFEVTDVIVTDGSFEVVDLRLSPANLQVETVTVTAKALKNTSASLLARRKKAVAVSDGISAQQIRQGTDSNAAEAVNRVTGLSVVGGKYVYVRGLGERYSSAQLNGSVVGSPEANRRVLPLDLFPSSLLDNIVVQKTYTPDQPAEFGGGAVNVTTLDFPTNETWSFRVKGGANALVTGSDFRTYSGGSRDWLGFDDGTRGFPSLIDELAHDDLIKTPGSIINPGPFTADEVRDMGRSFSKVWSPSTGSGHPAYSFSGTYGNLVDFLGRDLGFVASVSQGNSFSQYDYLDRRYENGDPLILADDLAAARSVTETSLGGLVNGALRVNSANTLRFTTNYTRTSHDEVRFREGSIDNDETVRQTRLRFIERGLLATTVGMDHTLRALGNSELKWRVDYSEATRDVPDQRSFQYENVGTDADPDWRLAGGAAAKAPNRSFESMTDVDRNARADFEMPFDLKGRESRFKVGYAHKNKDRSSEARRFWFQSPSSGNTIDDRAPIEEILADENIGGRPISQFALVEWTRPVDGYTASQDVEAFYGMAELPITRKLLLVGGVRHEAARQEVATVHRLWAKTYEPDLGVIDETNILPAANLRYSLTENVNFRAGFSKTLNRPDLRELSNGEWDDSDRNRKFLGNPELKQAELTNFDLRLEWFPTADELLAVSAFTKDLGDPIEYAVFVATGSNDPLYQPVNTKDGKLSGLEFESRLALARLGGGILERLGASANLTLIDSSAKLPESLGQQTDNSRPLTGQSSYMVNAGLQFVSTNRAVSSSVQYNVFGRRIDAIGVLSSPNIWEEPRHALDWTASYDRRGVNLKFSVENLLDSPVRYTQGDKDTEVRDLGRTFGLSLGYGSSN